MRRQRPASTLEDTRTRSSDGGITPPNLPRRNQASVLRTTILEFIFGVVQEPASQRDKLGVSTCFKISPTHERRIVSTKSMATCNSLARWRFGLVLATKQRRSGFTLLEVVLALGLSSLLMAAIYSALQMHWSYSLVGQVEMERAQVARALFRRLEVDLRSVIFRSAPLSSTTDNSASSSTSGSSATSSGSTGSTGSTGGVGQGTSASTGSNGAGTGSTGSTAGGSTSSASDSTTTATEPVDAYSTQKSGLFGDADSLVVHVCLPSRFSSGMSATTGQSATAGVALSSSDLQSVAYFLAGSSSSLAQQFSGALTSAAMTRPGQQLGGLARVQADRMAMQAASDSGDMSSMSGNVKLLAPEVSSIQFEFFDGVSWTSTWDSATSTSLPNAVRVTIDFHPPDTSRTGWFSRSTSQSTNRFQQIIALPLAEPYIEEAS